MPGGALVEESSSFLGVRRGHVGAEAASGEGRAVEATGRQAFGLLISRLGAEE